MNEIDPKPYLDYLGKEMTIMGLLSAFCIAVVSFTAQKIMTAETNPLAGLWTVGHAHVLAGTGSAVVAAYFFYLQRGHLAWYYGQIALAQVLGESSPSSVREWLAWADGWETWVRYQTGFLLLVFSALSYGYAALATQSPALAHLNLVWSLFLPLGATMIVILFRAYALTHADDSYTTPVRDLLRRLKGVKR